MPGGPALRLRGQHLRCRRYVLDSEIQQLWLRQPAADAEPHRHRTADGYRHGEHLPGIVPLCLRLAAYLQCSGNLFREQGTGLPLQQLHDAGARRVPDGARHGDHLHPRQLLHVRGHHVHGFHGVHLLAAERESLLRLPHASGDAQRPADLRHCSRLHLCYAQTVYVL